MYYITLETIYSGLSKSNFKDHYGDAAKEQCLGMIAEINMFSASDKMLRVMRQTGRSLHYMQSYVAHLLGLDNARNNK